MQDEEEGHHEILVVPHSTGDLCAVSLPFIALERRAGDGEHGVGTALISWEWRRSEGEGEGVMEAAGAAACRR